MWQGQQRLCLWSGWKCSPESAESGGNMCFRNNRALAQQHHPFHKNLYLNGSKDCAGWDLLPVAWCGLQAPRKYVHLPNDGSICKRPFPLTFDPLLLIFPWGKVGTAGMSMIGNVSNGIAGQVPLSTPSFLSFSLLSHPKALTDSYAN